MSTTFDVFPSTSYTPTFEEVINLAEVKIHNFLIDINVDAQPQICVDLHAQNPDTIILTDVKNLAKWSSEYYAWFTITSVNGGTDVYFYDLENQNDKLNRVRQSYKVDVLQKQNLDQEIVKNCVRQQHHWSFRRSAGQPSIINVAYGFIASAFAELTKGFIFTDDAWDHNRFPALTSEFDTWYFRPELALNKKSADWARRCIESIEYDFEKSDN